MEAMRHIVFLNSKGDIEVSWDKDSDAQMLQVIEAKMKAGVRFFVFKPIKGTGERKKTRIKKIDEVSGRSITFDDPDLEAMFASGKVSMTRSDIKSIDCEGSLKTAQEVVASKKPTVAVRPFQGG